MTAAADPEVLIGGADGVAVAQHARMANRHGLVAGATGTGKTITLQVLAEGFSRLGVPVFAADIKGDLSGIAAAGTPHPKIDERLARMPPAGYTQRAYPTVFWDLYGETGHPLRTTISEIGPLLLSNLLELNDTQSGVLYAAFKVADDNGMLLLDLKDLRSMLSWVADNTRELRGEYGNLSPASVAAIQRSLLVLEEQGGDRFFGEPALDVGVLLQRDFSGNGVIHLLDATRLTQQAPRLYATFLLWLLSELFENLPEQGDAPMPKFVMFFDEAHLLFDQAPRALLDKVEQVVRLIRSKGVGVYFVTQSPLDIPEDVLGQLGMRVQHALRAFTPKDRKAVRSVAETFRQSPGLDTATVITELGTGEALVSTLDARGSPTPVQRTVVRPPESRIGPLDEAERRERLQRSPYAGRYDQVVDRESAYEILQKRAADMARTVAAEKALEAERKAEQRAARSAPGGGGSSRQGIGEALIKSAMRAVGSQVGRQLGSRLVRGLLGSLLGGR